MYPGGWAGRLLRVDLTGERMVTEPVKAEWAENFMGGRGLTSKLLFDEVRPGTDPLSPENKIFIAVGPCNGTLVPGSTRITIAAKSPLTGFIGDSNSGGTMGAELKYAGYDALVIQGKAPRPSYLWIDNDTVKLRPADHLWGKTTGETRRAIEREIGDPEVQVASIGPAGENLIKFANIINDVGRAHGRCGLGAVMGSKNLKAIAVRGTHGVRVADPASLDKAIREMYELYYHEDPLWYKNFTTYGTINIVVPYNKCGGLPTRNYQTGIFSEAENLFPEVFIESLTAGSRSCFSCPLHCQHYWVIGDGPDKGTFTEGVEMMDVCHFGSRLGNSNPDSVVKMHELSNEFGLDVGDISGAIGWALECFEKGILTVEETGGLRLEWGDHSTFRKLIEMIAYREGFGRLLAEGVKRASEIIGRGSEKFALHVKGLTIDARDPRGYKGWALAYAVASRGAEHCRALYNDELSDVSFNLSMEGKPEGVAWYENMRAVQNSLQICEFCGRKGKMLSPQMLLKFFNASTGSNITEEELLLIGERIVNIERAFNVREGLTREDDTLPERFLKEPMPEGPVKGQVVDLQPMIDRYYEIRGWDKETGFPKKTKLIELELTSVADELGGLGKLSTR